MSKTLGTSHDRMPLPLSCDYTSHDGAMKLAARIKEYWAARGMRPTIIIKAGGIYPNGRENRYDIRSNMVGGWP